MNGKYRLGIVFTGFENDVQGYLEKMKSVGVDQAFVTITLPVQLFETMLSHFSLGQYRLDWEYSELLGRVNQIPAAPAKAEREKPMQLTVNLPPPHIAINMPQQLSPTVINEVRPADVQLTVQPGEVNVNVDATLKHERGKEVVKVLRDGWGNFSGAEKEFVSDAGADGAEQSTEQPE